MSTTQDYEHIMLKDAKPVEAVIAFDRLHPARGVHILADFYDCSPKNPLLTNAEALQVKCKQMVAESGLNALKHLFYQFPESGVTGVILLAESHFSIHTWPEKNYLTLDIFVCNFSSNNTEKARRLYKSLETLFQPKKISHREIERD